MKISGEKERGREKRGGDDHPILVPRVKIYGEREEIIIHTSHRNILERKKRKRRSSTHENL